MLHRSGRTDREMSFGATKIIRLIQEEGVLLRHNRCRGLAKPNTMFFEESVSVLLPSYLDSCFFFFHSRWCVAQVLTQGGVTALHRI